MVSGSWFATGSCEQQLCHIHFGVKVKSITKHSFCVLRGRYFQTAWCLCYPLYKVHVYWLKFDKSSSTSRHHCESWSQLFHFPWNACKSVISDIEHKVMTHIVSLYHHPDRLFDSHLTHVRTPEKCQRLMESKYNCKYSNNKGLVLTC